MIPTLTIDWTDFRSTTQVYRPQSTTAVFEHPNGTKRILTVDGAPMSDWHWTESPEHDRAPGVETL